MNPIANPLAGAPNGVSPIVIEEDSTFRKVITCLPIVGAISSILAEFSLADKAIQTRGNRLQLIELIKVNNQYKMADVVRSLVSIALVVAGIALKALPTTSSPLIAIEIGLIGLFIFRMDQNNQLMSQLQTAG